MGQHLRSIVVIGVRKCGSDILLVGYKREMPPSALLCRTDFLTTSSASPTINAPMLTENQDVLAEHGTW